MSKFAVFHNAIMCERRQRYILLCMCAHCMGLFLCVSSCMPVGPVLVTESMLGCVNEHEGVCCVSMCAYLMSACVYVRNMKGPCSWQWPTSGVLTSQMGHGSCSLGSRVGLGRWAGREGGKGQLFGRRKKEARTKWKENWGKMSGKGMPEWL